MCHMRTGTMHSARCNCMLLFQSITLGDGLCMCTSTCAQLLALQLLEDLLVLSDKLSDTYISRVMSLLTAPSSTAAMKIQAVHAAGRVINQRPHQHKNVITELEDVLLHHQALSPQAPATSGKHTADTPAWTPTAGRGSYAPYTVAGENTRQGDFDGTSAQAVKAGMSDNSSFMQVVVAAAATYGQLLLDHKLQLSGRTYTVIAACLCKPNALVSG